jgi:hypothetical protein
MLRCTSYLFDGIHYNYINESVLINSLDTQTIHLSCLIIITSSLHNIKNKK